MPNILVANYDMGTLDEELKDLREPMITSEIKDYSVQSK